MKGIILAGGKATRLYPVTKTICKQLLPVYDKPLIYYPLSTLMLAGIRDILLISNHDTLPRFKDLLGDGSYLGINISYKEQSIPRGIAESFLIGKSFIASSNVCLILGDNIFYGKGLSGLLKDAIRKKEGATILGYYVKNPGRYGVIEFGRNSLPKAIVEKPKKPKSNYVVPGIYFYDNNVVEIARDLKPSGRGELEISDINNEYLRRSTLDILLLGRGYSWLDIGTHDSLIEASLFVKTLEKRQGVKLGCIEEAAYKMGYISREQLLRIAFSIPSSYGEYLKVRFGKNN